MPADRRTVNHALDHLKEESELWHAGEVSERDMQAAERFARLALEAYLEALRKG